MTGAVLGPGPGSAASAAGGRGAGCRSGYFRIRGTRKTRRRRRRTGRPWRRPRGCGARVLDGGGERAASWGLGFWRVLLLGRWDLEGGEEVEEAPTRGRVEARGEEAGEGIRKGRENGREGERVRVCLPFRCVCTTRSSSPPPLFASCTRQIIGLPTNISELSICTVRLQSHGLDEIHAVEIGLSKNYAVYRIFRQYCGELVVSLPVESIPFMENNTNVLI